MMAMGIVERLRELNPLDTTADLIEQQAERIKELEQQRDELLNAAENLIRVKGRYHTEQAYKKLEAAIAKVIGEMK